MFDELKKLFSRKPEVSLEKELVILPESVAEPIAVPVPEVVATDPPMQTVVAATTVPVTQAEFRPWNLDDAVKLHNEGWSLRALGQLYGVSKSYVHHQLKTHESRESVSTTTPEPIMSAVVSASPSISWIELSGLRGAGKAAAPSPIVEMKPAVIPPEPVVVRDDIAEMAPEVICGNPVPTPKPTPVQDDPEATIDWEAEKSTTLPTRSPARIQFLLKHENSQQLQARIMNDKAREMNRRNYASPNVQSAISNLIGGDRTVQWVRR